MQKILTLLICFFCFFQVRAQITITSSDMPVHGDTVRLSSTFILEGIDYEQAGPNFTWDFSSLTLTAQQVDTFLSVGETPLIFQGFFNNQFLFPDYVATVASKLSQFPALPGYEIGDSYQFQKNTTASYREVGFGINMAGLTLPLQYQQIDTIYRFPMVYGQVDSAHAFLSVDVPNMGYASIDRKRKNTVDGWGTLITPYGTFQTLRVRTDIHEFDSLYLDSLSTGVPLDRNITEYKWLANGFHAPVMQVSVEGVITTASYVDSLRSSFSGLYDYQGRNVHFSVYPNPSDDFISISYELLEDSEVGISIYSVYGNQIRQFMLTKQQRGLYNRVLYLKEYGFKPGIYLLRLTVNGVPHIKRILLN